MTGIFDLKRGQVAKRIFVEQGEPVYAESNLLHETLGKFLVEIAAITPEQEEAAVVRALETQRPFQEVVIELGAIDAANLYEAIRKNLAQKILDCFSWGAGSYAFSEGAEAFERITAFRMNAARLVIKGIETFVPTTLLEAGGWSQKDRRYKIVPRPPTGADVFQLTTEEVKFLRALKEGKTTEALGHEFDLSIEAVARKLMAFSILGLVVEASKGGELSLDELVGATLLQSLRPMEEPRLPVAEADAETLALANEIATDHMRLMALNHFELLDVAEDASPVQIRDKFIEFAVRYGPLRFRKPTLGEFRDRAEEIFLRGAKAFGTLSEFESKTKYLDKLKADRAASAAKGKKVAGEAFKIQTKLLEAEPQFQKGMKYLQEKNFAKAIEFFEYARDIDPRKPSYQSYLAWSRFQQSPERNLKEVEGALRAAREMKPESDVAAFLLGKFLIARGTTDEGLAHLRRAAEMSPKNLEMVREVRNVTSRGSA